MGACSGKDAAKDPDKAPYGAETAENAEKKDKGKKKKAPPKPPPPHAKGAAAEVPGDGIEKDEGAREDAKKSGAAEAADGDAKGVPVAVADVNDNKPTKDGSKKDKKDKKKDKKGSGSSSSSSDSSDSSDSGSSDGEKKDKKKKKKKKTDDGKDVTDVKLEIKEEGDDDKSKIEKKEEATVETPKSAFLMSNTPPARPAYTPQRPTFQLPAWYKPTTGATPPPSTYRDTTTTFKSTTTTTSSSSEKKSDDDIDPDSIIENIKSKSEKSPAPLPPARTSSSVVESKTEVVTTTTSEGDDKEAITKEKTVETVTVTQSVTGDVTETTETTEITESGVAVDEERKSLEASAEAVTITEEDEGIKTTTTTSTTENEDGGTVTRTTVISQTVTTGEDIQEASEEQEPEPVVNGEAQAEEAPAAEDVVSEEIISEGIVEQVEEGGFTKTITTEEESPEKVQELNDAQPIDAHVIISNGSAQPEDKTGAEEPASPKIEPQVQQELEPEPDLEPEPEPEPDHPEPPTPTLLVHVFNAKKALNELLPSFEASNNSIRETHKFSARAKLMNALDKWFSGADKDKENFSRSVAVTGKPELGKTCLAGELCTKYSPQLAGYHFFQYNNANLDHNDPRMVIQALAHWMCDTFSNYANMLPKVERVEDICTHGKVHELFEALIAKPLSSPALQHSQDEPMLIILDALDECDFSSRDSLLETLNKFNELTPEWLYLLVTTRDDNQILDKLDTFRCFEMKATQDSMLDIKRFLREPMSPYMDRISLDGGVTQLAKKANGSLLCASIYKSQLNAFPEDKRIALREIDGLFAAGISGVLQETCEQFKNWLSENAPRKEAQVLYNTILGTLILVREPIHMDFIQYCGSVKPEDVIHQLKQILAQEGSRVALRHQSVGEWLMSGQEAAENSVDLPTARDYLARFCLTWLRHVIGEGESVGSMNPELTAYALKHSIAHFTDVPKQQDNVANLLCSLTFLQEKLKLADVEARHITKDYKHEHHRLGSEKLVTLEDYMRKHPKLIEQIKSYYKFVQQKIADIKQCPDFLLQVAANYPTVQRIQQNARVEISDKPWIENLTAVADTDCTKKQIVGQICRVDIAPDGKTVAIVTKDDDYNVKLHLVNTASGEEKVPAVNIKSLPDRVGLAAKFFPDGANVFVGSLTNFVNTKGAVTSSGYDLSSIQMKEKFSIECCDISSKYVACGVTTFPFGGRSLHMVVFDQKSKKCAQALEVLKFRFGGSAQFGIRCCAISANETLLCTAVKQTNKAELKVTLWNTSKWSQTQAVDINNDQIMKCRFVADNTLLFSGSIRSQLTEDESIQKAMMWNFKDSEQQPQELDPRELGSVFHFNKGKTSMTRWLSSSGSASHMVWDRVGVTQQPSTIYSIRGLPPAMDVLAFGNLVVYVHSDQVVIYNTSDMELSNEGQKSPGPTCVQDVSAKSISFLPRSDTGLVSHNSIHSFTDGISISMLGALQEDMSLTPTVFENIDVHTNAIGSMTQNTHKYFRGSNASNLICSCTSDSNLVLMNTGNDIQIWDRGTNNVSDLPRFDELSERFQSELQDQTGLMHVVSPKDSLVAVVYNQLPELIYLYDVRSKKMVRMLSSSSAVTDFTVMPSTGFVVSYHKATSNTIVVWNQRNGQRVNEETMHIAYARTSPASDRLALSSRPAGKEVAVVLRNSDSRFRVTLDVPSTWLPGSSDSDLDFSPDGTILIGVSMDTGVCRVWNAGNGEVLRDLDVPFTRPAEIVGMLNNTHVVFHDETLLVVDVASGELIAMLPLEDNLERNTSPRGLRISPRGSVIIGANSHGQLHVFQCHNFLAIKRKTTLQRMKSISK